MSIIDIDKIVAENCLALKKHYDTLDCIIFISYNHTGQAATDIGGWPREFPEFTNIGYDDYNVNLSDVDWEKIRDFVEPLCLGLVAKYGRNYYYFVDVRKEEIKIIIDPDNPMVLKTRQFLGLF